MLASSFKSGRTVPGYPSGSSLFNADSLLVHVSSAADLVSFGGGPLCFIFLVASGTPKYTLLKMSMIMAK